MSGHITVHFGALEALSEEIARFLKSMINELDGLHDAMMPVLSTWEGEAREAWLARMDEWDSSMQGLQECYEWSRHLVDNARENYSGAHQAILRGWGAA
jgi:WXG100 family type VII secretion target